MKFNMNLNLLGRVQIESMVDLEIVISTFYPPVFQSFYVNFHIFMYTWKVLKYYMVPSSDCKYFAIM